jgi:hypothetical protein
MRSIRLLVPPLLAMLALAACGTPDAPVAAAPTAAPPPSEAATAIMPPATSVPPAPVIGPSAYPAPLDETPRSYPAPPTDTPTPLDQATDTTPAAQSGGGAGVAITAVAQGQVVAQTVPPGPQPTPTPLRGPATIGMQDHEQTLYLGVGETFQLKLGSQLIWTVQIEDERIVTRVPDAATNAETQGVYKALAAGQTTLMATGDPACRQSTPACMMPSFAFQLHIVVR